MGLDLVSVFFISILGILSVVMLAGAMFKATDSFSIFMSLLVGTFGLAVSIALMVGVISATLGVNP